MLLKKRAKMKRNAGSLSQIPELLAAVALATCSELRASARFGASRNYHNIYSITSEGGAESQPTEADHRCDIMSKKIALYAGIIILTGCAGFATTRPARSQEEPHQAFTVLQLEKRYDANNIEGYREERLYAVRADGSWSWMAERPGPDARLYNMGEIYNLGDRTIVTVDGITQSLQTQTLEDGDVVLYKKVDRSCQAGSERSVMAGYDVVKVPTPNDKGHFDAIDWKAPDLDCFSLQTQSTMWSRSGIALAQNIRETVFVLPGEPSPSLFSAPTGYIERSPSQAEGEYFRRFGQHPFSSDVLQRAEESYNKNHNQMFY